MTQFSTFKPKRALLSVSDKRGIVELATIMHQQNIELIATGNTAALLKKEGLPITEVSDRTGFPEMMDGRVKTLHPAIHAGLLARGEQDESILKRHEITPIDLLIVNLYPFEQVVSNPDCDFNEAIENIDIGGPAMIRSAAKNHAHTFVIVTPDDYPKLMECLQTQKAPSQWGFTLAKKAFALTAAYDAAIISYLSSKDSQKRFPEVFTGQFRLKKELRYGENPHQNAAFYADKKASSGSLGFAAVLQGKELSYNNILDADAALDCVKSFSANTPLCVIVKHGNPCGIAQGTTLLNAYLKAFQCDPLSAFGGIIAFNQKLDEAASQTLIEKQFVEVIIAPSFSDEAKRVLLQKENIRVLETGHWQEQNSNVWSLRKVDGGLLVQDHDVESLSIQNLKIVTEKKPSEQQMQDLLFAWLAVKHVKSNAIVYAKDCATIGIGGGQTSRVMSARIGLWQAEQRGLSTQGAVMASDAFIPFTDTLELAVQGGIVAVIQPGGSIKDKEIIAFAKEKGLIMVFTGIRHFKH